MFFFQFRKINISKCTKIMPEVHFGIFFLFVSNFFLSLLKYRQILWILSAFINLLLGIFKIKIFANFFFCMIINFHKSAVWNGILENWMTKKSFGNILNVWPGMCFAPVMSTEIKFQCGITKSKSHFQDISLHYMHEFWCLDIWSVWMLIAQKYHLPFLKRQQSI